MPYRKQYIALTVPAWPPNEGRMKMIYATIARPLRNPDPALKGNLLTAIQAELTAFDANYAVILFTQATFNDWFTSTAGRIMTIPFTWTDASGGTHYTLPFGAAQKFLNLSLKDWWALSPNGTNPATLVDRLHGALDQIVYSCTSRYCHRLPSLQGPNGIDRSYVYNLTPADYLAYQGHLDAISVRLTTGLHLPGCPNRVEIEQLLWGWL
jgi:hypothetical protein